MRENEGKRGAKGANAAGKVGGDAGGARCAYRGEDNGGEGASYAKTEREKRGGGGRRRLYVQGTVTFPTLITVNH